MILLSNIEPISLNRRAACPPGYRGRGGTRRKTICVDAIFLRVLRVLCGKGFWTFAVLACTSWSAIADLPAPIADALKRANIPESALALHVQDLNQPAPLLALNAEHAMNPASVIKLVTTYAALETLGPAYQWKTEFYANGVQKGGKLTGDLIIKGYGDPKITLETFWLWLRDLRTRGISEIKGNIVLDRGVFDIPNEDPGAFDGEPYKPYNTQPDALLLNFRSHRIRFLPEEDGKKLRIAFEVAIPEARIVNQVRLVSGGCGNWKDALAYRVQQTPKGLVLYFSGPYPAACGEKSMHLALLDPPAYVHALFKPLWEELGGKWRGQIVDGVTPADARLLARHDSPQLAEIIRDINKFSNNVMARQLYLTLGAEMLGVPATLEKSNQAVNVLLATKGLNFLELVMGNGAGLSRQTRISARHIGDLLRAAFHSPAFAEFESSLPIVATDGTMKKRLKDNAVAGHAHIKTGSLDGVRTLAGYVHDAKGRRMAVVCLINHPHAEAGRPVQDALLEWVYDRP
ncbi:MAG: D-alanyl-D-alanine carboxypeptidase/D-alanyl-D-alanine-endopeptidase [Hydrogenophilales bacterium]|nr:D-alanyl-D-alanine carboxypeptidase/D-alanyl-D-alanine-endopeptidase [Hydrogenophilales bacterium]